MIAGRIAFVTTAHRISLEDLAEAIGWQRSSALSLVAWRDPNLRTVHRIARGLTELHAPTRTFSSKYLELEPDTTLEGLRENLLAVIDRGIERYAGVLPFAEAVVNAERRGLDETERRSAIESVRRGLYGYRRGTYPRARHFSIIARTAGTPIVYLAPIRR